MNYQPDVCYQALLARDRRFDGLFFVAVRSTHIYCRPVCTVKPPYLKNCTFYANAASCERDGYRPCLRCRPELAPGNASVDSRSRLISRAIDRIEDGALSTDSIEQLAEELGVTSRHLRRVFESEIGVTPVQYVQTQRLLLAKHLLTDTTLPVTQIAMSSGFQSVRRFNALFLERYRLNPSELRKSVFSKPISSDTFICQLSYRPPYDWDSLLNFLRTHSATGVEFIDQHKYMRTIAIDDVRGWLSITPSEKPYALEVSLSSSLAPKFLQILSRLKRLFDLQARPELIEQQLGCLATSNPGLRVPGACDSFEVAIRAILGQVVSVKAGSTFAGRLAKKFGREINTPYPELSLLSPLPEALAAATVESITQLGVMSTRARTIISFAKSYASGELNLQPGADYESTVAKLTSLPGIGEWTAASIAMRCLAYPDAFPHADLALRKALGLSTKKAMLLEAEKYRPWRAYATMHMWKSLEKKVV